MPFSRDVLTTIHLIAKCGSFAVAAERLNRVPSSVSYTVKKLEDELGFPLFDRSGRQARLTDAGQYFIDQSQWLVDSYDELVRNTAMISAGAEVSFSVAINNIVNREGLVDFIEQLDRQFPATRISVKTEVYNGCWDALYDRRADLVIGAPHAAPKLEGIVHQSIGHIDWDFVVSRQHPLARRTAVLGAEALRAYPAIVVKDTSLHILPQDTWSLAGQKIIYAPDLTVAINMIERGIGIGYVPHHRIREWLDEGWLLKKAIVEHKQPTQLFYAWHANRESPVLQWCTDYLTRSENRLRWCQ
ncbi:LysR substrate-binding domain-containing protein [Halomonas saccharevitans]|uniref:DNA-binding transcriptional regulator, LysR family n=1 Tax=Halomonas saccharevitans TaxID=416872 RepID=A0A1I7CZQ0_9GAMM|nr:LysR substrate-binding domain-containing protein [Halomonas saccharevitans]MDT8877984.1 LysR substrate-binding domain-containing protein [Halomonas saccharevitans]SFU04928.1 DNA-binding transcriptional regulator, LysR family [Halomonas saccharevitans]